MLSSALRNARGYRVELLTPHQGADERGDDLVPLPSLPGLGAQPLRFLDYLLYGEVPTVVLHGPGIAVNVPAPERYAVHKLIVATRRVRRRPAEGGQGRGPGRQPDPGTGRDAAGRPAARRLGRCLGPRPALAPGAGEGPRAAGSRSGGAPGWGGRRAGAIKLAAPNANDVCVPRIILDVTKALTVLT